MNKKKQVWLYPHEWGYIALGLKRLSGFGKYEDETIKALVGSKELLRIQEIALKAAQEENHSGVSQPDSVTPLRKQV